MEIQNVIVRKPVSITNKLEAAAILSSIDISKFPKSTEEIDALPLAKKVEVMRIAAELDHAAKLLGFLGVKEMTDFTNMYGPEALIL